MVTIIIILIVVIIWCGFCKHSFSDCELNKANSCTNDDMFSWYFAKLFSKLVEFRKMHITFDSISRHQLTTLQQRPYGSIEHSVYSCTDIVHVFWYLLLCVFMIILPRLSNSVFIIDCSCYNVMRAHPPPIIVCFCLVIRSARCQFSVSVFMASIWNVQWCHLFSRVN